MIMYSPNLRKEEKIVDLVLCWFSNEQQCFIPYTAEELTQKLKNVYDAVTEIHEGM
jgi:hypothetical protein